MICVRHNGLCRKVGVTKFGLKRSDSDSCWSCLISLSREKHQQFALLQCCDALHFLWNPICAAVCMKWLLPAWVHTLLLPLIENFLNKTIYNKMYDVFLTCENVVHLGSCCCATNPQKIEVEFGLVWHFHLVSAVTRCCDNNFSHAFYSLLLLCELKLYTSLH